MDSSPDQSTAPILKGRDSLPDWRKILAILALVVIVFMGLYAVAFYPLWDQTPEKAGTLGDMFGALNTFFSGLALAGVVAAIVLQSMQLRAQMVELEETREELRRSANAQERMRHLQALHLESLRETGDPVLSGCTVFIFNDPAPGRGVYPTATVELDPRSPKPGPMITSVLETPDWKIFVDNLTHSFSIGLVPASDAAERACDLIEPTVGAGVDCIPALADLEVDLPEFEFSFKNQSGFTRTIAMTPSGGRYRAKGPYSSDEGLKDDSAGLR